MQTKLLSLSNGINNWKELFTFISMLQYKWIKTKTPLDEINGDMNVHLKWYLKCVRKFLQVLEKNCGKQANTNLRQERWISNPFITLFLLITPILNYSRISKTGLKFAECVEWALQRDTYILFYMLCQKFMARLCSCFRGAVALLVSVSITVA